MASVVAESRPPETRTTAFCMRSSKRRCDGRPKLTPRRVAPEIFVQLNLKPHRQALIEHPLRKLVRRHLLVARTEEHRAERMKRPLTHQIARPFEILSIANHELD